MHPLGLLIVGDAERRELVAAHFEGRPVAEGLWVTWRITTYALPQERLLETRRDADGAVSVIASPPPARDPGPGALRRIATRAGARLLRSVHLLAEAPPAPA